MSREQAQAPLGNPHHLHPINKPGSINNMSTLHENDKDIPLRDDIRLLGRVLLADEGTSVTSRFVLTDVEPAHDVHM